jgi:hypothetical protein
LATKVHWVRRAWALVEVVGAVGNIVVNTQDIDPNSLLGQVVNSYNLAMGVIGIKNLGQAGYKFAKNLPQATKELLQKKGNLRAQLVAYYQKWQNKVSKLDETISYNQKEIVFKQRKTFQLLGIDKKIQELKKAKYPENFEEFVNQAFNASQKKKLSIAKEFYSKFNPNFNINELRGIDFDKAVEIVSAQKGKIMYQMVRLDETGKPRFGSYFFESVDEDITKLGIGKMDRIIKDERVKIKVILDDKIDFLKSKSADIEDWTGTGEIFDGGGTQFYSPIAKEKIKVYEIIK